MATRSEELHLRLFLEGIEVPVIGANISINTDFPATAQIQIIATPEALRLKERTLVHLFTLDDQVISELGEDPIKAEFGSNYSLIFCGEVLGLKTEVF